MRRLRACEAEPGKFELDRKGKRKKDLPGHCFWSGNFSLFLSLGLGLFPEVKVCPAQNAAQAEDSCDENGPNQQQNGNDCSCQHHHGAVGIRQKWRDGWLQPRDASRPGIPKGVLETKDLAELRHELKRLLQMRKKAEYPMVSLDGKDRQVAYWRISLIDIAWFWGNQPILHVDQVLRTNGERSCPERRFADVTPDEKGVYHVHYGFHEKDPSIANNRVYAENLDELAKGIGNLIMGFAKEIGLKLRAAG